MFNEYEKVYCFNKEYTVIKNNLNEEITEYIDTDFRYYRISNDLGILLFEKQKSELNLCEINGVNLWKDAPEVFSNIFLSFLFSEIHTLTLNNNRIGYTKIIKINTNAEYSEIYHNERLVLIDQTMLLKLIKPEIGNIKNFVSDRTRITIGEENVFLNDYKKNIKKYLDLLLLGIWYSVDGTKKYAYVKICNTNYVIDSEILRYLNPFQINLKYLSEINLNHKVFKLVNNKYYRLTLNHNNDYCLNLQDNNPNNFDYYDMTMPISLLKHAIIVDDNRDVVISC